MASKTAAKVMLVIVAGVFLGALIAPSTAGAIEVKKSLYTGGGGGGGGAGGGGKEPARANPLTKAQQQALQDAVASDSDRYLAEESEKKSSGDPYVDLEHAKFSYVPAGGSVTAKLQAPEYKLKKGAEGKGRPTGVTKELVFKYKMEGSKLTPDGDPTWAEVTAKAK